MNILVFCYEFPPVGAGAGNATYYLSREWARLGHQVEVVTSHFGDLKNDEAIDGVRVIRLPVRRQSVSRGRLTEMLRYMIQTAQKSDGYYRDFRPDVCVSFLTIPGGIAPYLLWRRRRVPYVCELRGGDVPDFYPQALAKFHFWTRPFIYAMWKHSRVLIANGGGLQRLAKRGPNPNIEYIPNGVDAEVFHAAARMPASVFRLLFVGRFVDSQKNISHILKAVARLEQVSLVLVGDGPDKETLAREIEALNLSGRVTMKGWLRGQALLTQYHEADAYISASHWEGMSNSALEAMATGLPLLLSDIDGHRELVMDGQNGYLFSPKDLSKTIECVSKLAKDRQLCETMSGQSRRRCQAEFDWRQLAPRHLRLFEKAISK